VRKFNSEAASIPGTTVLCISKDLPFAHKRFCGAEGIQNVVSLSALRSDFGKDYGVQIVDGPLTGLFARSVVVVDEKRNVIYTQLVPEIKEEPNYGAALTAVK
jgi:thiol peroxidase